MTPEDPPFLLYDYEPRADPDRMETHPSAKAGQYLTFFLSDRAYGVPIGSVREINRMTQITPVPKTPIFIAGVMNLRGKIVPVIDLRIKLGLEFRAASRSTCIIVIESQNRLMGVIVDSVNSVIDLEPGQVEPTPELGDSSRLGHVIGMGKVENDLVILLDIAATLSAQELEAAHQAAA
ncbi:MAG: chemotaxis protein CheW [Oligoflexia bacterium]